MSYNTPSEEWCLNIQESLAQIRRDISNKADRSLVEQIRRQEIEKKKIFLKAKQLPTDVNLNESTLGMCNDYVEKGDLDTAFLLVLRYIEKISTNKADSEEISQKATREYVEKIFFQLEIMNREQMSKTSNILHKKIEERIQVISKKFEVFSSAIDQRLTNATTNLNTIDEQMAGLSGLVQVRQTSQVSKSKLKKEADNSSLDIIPTKPKKPKNSGIVMPTYYKPKPEPTAKALCPAITVTTEKKKTKSLLVTD